MSETTVHAAELGEIVAVTREFARAEVLPRALALDDGDKDAFDACWLGVCEMGLPRALLSESAGGVGLSLGELMAVLEELAVGDGGIAACTLLSNGALLLTGERTLDGSGARAAARPALVPMPRPGLPGAGALTIAGTSASGMIAFALGGWKADELVVIGRADGEDAVVTIARDAAGMRFERDEGQLGLRGAPAAVVRLSDTPCERLGDADLARTGRVLLHAGIAAIARGIARRARELALEYAEQRFQGGSTIVQYGAVRDMLARISERNRAIAQAAAFAGQTLDGRLGAAQLAAALAAKAAASDAAAESTTDAVQVFGGTGYMHEAGVEKLMRDARYCQLFPQPNWITRDELLELERAR